MGLGIWSMHFVGMLAYQLPVRVGYHWPTVLLSLLAAMAVSGIALSIAAGRGMSRLRLGLGGVLMGIGIAAMHYIGMEAMRLPAMCHYSGPWVALSVVLAIVISWVALCLTFYFQDDCRPRSWRKLLSAVVMGLAIPAMHYTGMAAVTYVPEHGLLDLRYAVEVSSLDAVVITVFTSILLGLTILTILVDRRFSVQSAKFQQLLVETEAARASQATAEESGIPISLTTRFRLTNIPVFSLDCSLENFPTGRKSSLPLSTRRTRRGCGKVSQRAWQEGPITTPNFESSCRMVRCGTSRPGRRSTTTGVQNRVA
jgi:NO-binding membrane sensor protein with MHYT domain